MGARRNFVTNGRAVRLFTAGAQVQDCQEDDHLKFTKGSRWGHSDYDVGTGSRLSTTERANLLAGRLWRRKDSPGGMLQFGMEAAVYVSGNWPDVALMLGLGEYRVPRVG